MRWRISLGGRTGPQLGPSRIDIRWRTCPIAGGECKTLLTDSGVRAYVCVEKCRGAPKRNEAPRHSDWLNKIRGYGFTSIQRRIGREGCRHNPSLLKLKSPAPDAKPKTFPLAIHGHEVVKGLAPSLRTEEETYRIVSVQELPVGIGRELVDRCPQPVSDKPHRCKQVVYRALRTRRLCTGAGTEFAALSMFRPLMGTSIGTEMGRR